MRAKHDPFCNHCVARFDHHCQFTQACVGNGNHVIFMNFLVVTILGQIFFAYMGFKCKYSSPSPSQAKILPFTPIPSRRS